MLVSPTVCSAPKFRSERISILRYDLINISLIYKRPHIYFCEHNSKLFCCVGFFITSYLLMLSILVSIAI